MSKQTQYKAKQTQSKIHWYAAIPQVLFNLPYIVIPEMRNRSHQNGVGVPDGSNTARLTLDNASTLNVSGTIWIADFGGTKGRIDVLGGSTLNVAGDIKVGDDDLSIGTLNIIDSIVDIGDDLIIANRDGSTGYMNISGNSVINVVDRFYMNDGGGGCSCNEWIQSSMGFVRSE